MLDTSSACENLVYPELVSRQPGTPLWKHVPHKISLLLSRSLARSLARALSLFLPLCSRPLDACVAASRSVTRGAKAKCLHLFPPPSLASIKKPSSSPLRGGAQHPPRAPPRSPPRSLLLICINPQPHHHLSTNHYQAR